MKTIRLAYANMWPNMNPRHMPQDYFFEYVLSQHYNVEYNTSSPDILIYSVFGEPPDVYQLPHHTLRIAYSGEPYDAKGPADLFIGSKISESPYYFRLPFWAICMQWDTQPTLYIGLQGQGAHHIAAGILSSKNENMRMSNLQKRHLGLSTQEKFCNFTYSKPVKERIEFFLKLNQYKKVDSTGAVFNNTGYHMQNKSLELSNYKFTIAFENTVTPGYVTEKLLEPLAAGSIPIYHGSDECVRDFNPQSFIKISDFSSWDDAVEYIKLVDNTEDLRQQYLNAPIWLKTPNYPAEVFERIYSVLIRKNPHLAI